MKYLKRAQPIELDHLQNMFLWQVDLCDIEANEVAEAKQMLDERALENSLKFKFEGDQRHSIIVHAILRYYLGQLLRKEPYLIEIKRTQFGKPFISNFPLHFNLSHTKTHALLAIHHLKPIGVDIEIVNFDQEISHLANHICSSSEKVMVDDSADPIHWFFRFWCAKEALLKAEGTGFLADQIPIFDEVKRLSEVCYLFTCKGLNVFVYDNIVKGHKLAICRLP